MKTLAEFMIRDEPLLYCIFFQYRAMAFPSLKKMQFRMDIQVTDVIIIDQQDSYRINFGKWIVNPIIGRRLS